MGDGECLGLVCWGCGGGCSGDGLPGGSVVGGEFSGPGCCDGDGVVAFLCEGVLGDGFLIVFVGCWCELCGGVSVGDGVSCWCCVDEDGGS